MIEMLAREVLPRRLEEAWTPGARPASSTAPASEAFRITFTRGPQGIRIQAGARQAPAPPAALAPAPAPAPAAAPARPPMRPGPRPAAAATPWPRPLFAGAAGPARARTSTAAPSRPPSAGCTGTWRTSWTSASWAPASCWRSWRPWPRPRPGASFQEHNDADFAYPFESGRLPAAGELLPGPHGARLRVPGDPQRDPRPRPAGPGPSPSGAWPCWPRAWCWSPAPPARASPPPWPPSSTWPTSSAPTTSSPSRTPSSSCTRASAAW